jgi:hypothetical protein
MSELDKCIERGSLKRFEEEGTDAVQIELRAAREDLSDAEFVFAHDMPKRTTITAYYAMFHAARDGHGSRVRREEPLLPARRLQGVLWPGR